MSTELVPVSLQVQSQVQWIRYHMPRDILETDRTQRWCSEARDEATSPGLWHQKIISDILYKIISDILYKIISDLLYKIISDALFLVSPAQHNWYFVFRLGILKSERALYTSYRIISSWVFQSFIWWSTTQVSAANLGEYSVLSSVEFKIFHFVRFTKSAAQLSSSRQSEAPGAE